MTEWVSPQEGCNYCHNPDNLADDSKYQKVVSRRMIEMTRHINMDWKAHVAGTGVTCYTCHRGKNVPEVTWFSALPERARGLLAKRDSQNLAAPQVGLTSLPEDPFSTFLLGADPIRVIPERPLPGTGQRNIKETEHTYALMVHMSEALGVNCTFCHNSRSFAQWDASTPQRTTSWYGIRMARDLNNNFLLGLTAAFPAHRLGPGGDVAKINCATCHREVSKPFYGESLAKFYPELTRVRELPPLEPAAPEAAGAAAPVAAAAAATPLAAGG
jgi:photosynthetic reaction center cytochrome c subunit